MFVRILFLCLVITTYEAVRAAVDISPSLFILLFDSDNACNDTADNDGDRLLNCYETNTGVFNGPEDTGTNPNIADTDGDAISDGDEVLGTTGGLNLPAMGVSPLRKNILLEYDWFNDSLDCGPHSHRPTAAVIARFANAFENSPVTNPDGSVGITTINDYGQGGIFTGGNLINDSNGVLSGGVGGPEFLNHKAGNFAANRNGYFHYVILPHRYNTSSSSSGQAELPGDDMIVSLYCSNSTNNVANTIMHELGHNINLRHGGDTGCNYKPNYNSVMNYRYQFPGVDSNCDVQGDGLLDFSRDESRDLNEISLNESLGKCVSPITAVDWNGNGVIESGVLFDTNASDSSQSFSCGGILTTLTDYDDWANMIFYGITDADGAQLRPVEIISCENPPPGN